MKKKAISIDPQSIVLDSAGRYELADAQLAEISGGKKKKSIEIIVAGTCRRDGKITRRPVTHVCSVR